MIFKDEIMEEKKLQQLFQTIKKYSQINAMSRFEEPVVD